MQPLRAPRATIVPVPALVVRKADADPKVDAVRKADVDQKVDADPKADVDPKVDADPKADVVRKTDVAPKVVAARKTDAVLKTGAVQKVVAVPVDARSQEWSLLSVRQFPAARLTRRGSRLQAFPFGRLRLQSQDHVAVLVAKAPMVPVADLVDLAYPVARADQVVPAAVPLRVVIANRASRATCANRGRHTSKFFTSSACFSM
jgi:hypothetical protein